MKLLKTIAAIALVSVALAGHAFGELRVVTTLSSYADIAEAIGGDQVAVSSIAPPRFNPHFIEPRPSDVLKVKRCDLFIHSGLDLEAWRDPLINAAGRSDLRSGGANSLDLSTGISLLEIPSGQISRAEGDIHLYGNPHYWLAPTNGVIIAQEIAQRLIAIDPEHRELYKQNELSFTTKLNAKIKEWREAAKPFVGSELVGYHNEWVYLMNFLGFQMKLFLEPKPGIPPSPQHIEMITRYMKDHSIRAIIQSSYFSLDAANTIARSTECKVLLLSQNVGEQNDSQSYLEMIDSNIQKILGALRHE